MSTNVATDLCRVVLVTPKTSAEVALPTGIAVGDLLPTLVVQSGAAAVGDPAFEQGWVLQRLGHEPFDEEATPASLGIREGETLHLRPMVTKLPTVHFDDLIDGIAIGMRERKDRWRDWMTRWLFLGITGVSLALALVALWSGPVLVRGALAGVAALLLIVGAAACSRAIGDRGAAALLAMGAIPFATVAGLVVPTAPAEPALAAPNLLTAGIAAALAAMLGLAAVGNANATFGALALVGGATAATGLLGTLFGLSLPRSAAVMTALTLAVSTLVPMASFRLSRMRLPMLPTSAEDLGEDIDPLPGKDVLASTAVADRYLTSMTIAVGAILAGCATILVRSDGWASAAIAATAALVLVLRSRALQGGWQRLGTLVPAAYAFGLLIVSYAHRAEWTDRLTLMAVPLLAVAGGSVVFAQMVPGRRIHPVWGRVADVTEWLAAIAMIPLVLGVLGVYAWARAMGG